MEQTNNISCDVARDLLPLYADNVLSADSRALVDGHLPGCPPCSQELEALRRPAEQPKFSASRGLRQSKNRLRRAIAIAAASVAVLVGVLCFWGFSRVPLGPDVTIPFEENPIDMGSLYRFHAAQSYTGIDEDYLWMEPNRLPRYEWASYGSMTAEDVITIDGVRTGVAFIQMGQPESQKELSLRKYEDKGRNEMIVALGGMSIALSPMTETDKAALVADWETLSGLDNSGAYERANFARDIPITKLYYYNGPFGTLKNDPLGWSERDGILKDCVLVWDAETSPQGRRPPSYILAPRIYLSEPSANGEIATTAVYRWDDPAED